MKIMGEKTELLQRLVSASDVRQNVISQNIANVNTPGYKAQEVRFEDQLTAELNRASVSALPAAEPEIASTAGLPARNDGNNVDLDREVGELNKNAMMMQTYLRMIGAEMRMMRDAMDGP